MQSLVSSSCYAAGPEGTTHVEHVIWSSESSLCQLHRCPITDLQYKNVLSPLALQICIREQTL